MRHALVVETETHHTGLRHIPFRRTFLELACEPERAADHNQADEKGVNHRVEPERLVGDEELRSHHRQEARQEQVRMLIRPVAELPPPVGMILGGFGPHERTHLFLVKRRSRMYEVADRFRHDYLQL